MPSHGNALLVTDWTLLQDDVLLTAFVKANEKVMSEHERIQKKLWEYTAQEVNRDVTQPRFSAKACRDRYDALHNGTARVPPELDDDPEARKRERDARLAAYEVRKRKEEEAKAHAAALKREENSQKAMREKLKTIRIARQMKEKKRKENEQRQQKEFLRNAQQARKAERERQMAAFKAENDKKRRMKQAHMEVTEQLTKDLEQKNKDEQERIARENAHRRKARLYAATTVPSQHASLYAGSTHPARQAKTANLPLYEPDSLVVSANNEVYPSNLLRTAGQHLTPTPTQTASNAAVPDARELVCDMKELYRIFDERKMSNKRKKDVKSVVCARLRDNEEQATIEQLKQWLHKRGVSTYGPKDMLIQRLREADARNSPHFNERHAAVLNSAKVTPTRRITQRPNGASRSLQHGLTSSRRAGPIDDEHVRSNRRQAIAGAEVDDLDADEPYMPIDPRLT